MDASKRNRTNRRIAPGDKRTAEQLQDALDYSENILSTIREALLVLDANLRIVSANQSFYRLFSVSQEETVGKLIYEIDNGQWNIPKLRELLEEILPQNTSFENFEVDHEFPQRGRRVMLLNARRLHNGGLKAEKILLAIEDMTERRALDRGIAFSELRYRRLFETAQDGILILNAETGAITDANPFLSNILGFSKQELLGKRLWDIGFFKDSAASHEVFSVLQEKGYVRYEDLPLETRDGRPIEVEFVSNVYPIDGERVIQCNIRDVTERKKMEGTLKQYMGRLQDANKELESFSYSVSHDLKAPLRRLDGFAQAVIEDYADKLDEKGSEYLSRIRESSQLMSQLIDDMLRLSRVTATELVSGEVDLSDLAHQVVGELVATAPGRTVEWIISPGIYATGDVRLLRQVMENLLGNALKFTGKVPQARIELGFTDYQGERAYFVKDNGAGFDMAYAAKLFTPFQSLHSAADFAGTGIGLSIVQRIIHLHGGKTWAVGETGKGATFYFTLGV